MSTNPASPHARFANGTRFGNYEVTGFVGEGGMGTVYAAVHLGLGKRVAIKTLSGDLASNPAMRARFLREGKAAAAVRHPNVVDVDDVGVEGDTPYLAMELLEGEDLRSELLRLGRLTVEQTVDHAIPVLMALAEAHRAGVVHRDLKPDNIFLTRDFSGAAVPKLLDFGISKLRETQSLDLTGNNTMLGTPYYMSPEQCGSAREVDARSDLYSLGVILYHCTTGNVPFGGSSLAQVIGQIMHGAPIPLHEACPDAPAGFEAVVLRAIARDRNARYASALELATDLLPFASHRVQVAYGAVLSPGPQTLRLPSQPGVSVVPPPPESATLQPLTHSVSTQPVSTASPRRWGPWLLLLAAVVLMGMFVLLQRPDATPAQAAVAPPAAEPASSAPPTELPLPREQPPVISAQPPSIPVEAPGPVLKSRPLPAGVRIIDAPRDSSGRRLMINRDFARVRKLATKPSDEPAVPPTAAPASSEKDDAIWGDRR